MKLGGAEDLERAEEVVQGLVRRSPDQWSYYVSLLDLLDKRSGEIYRGRPRLRFFFIINEGSDFRLRI